ncbi:Nn.00g067630.m01.CDS01 [Neocucurbitaria sp. VM-36]
MPLCQTVFRVTLKDGIDGIQASKEPIPKAGNYEVLVKIRSVALNYRDIAIANSKYPLPTRDQVIPTFDMAGEIVEVGNFVDGLSVGDCVIPPPSASFNKWAAVVCTGATVWNVFYGNMPLKPGDTVLLQGTGGVSITGLIFAKAAGAKTIITSSSDEKLEYARSLGADYSINYKTHPNWALEILRITDGQGADHIIENGGIGTIEQSLQCIATSGTISLIGFLSDVGQGQPHILMPALVEAVVVRGVRGGSKHQLEEVVRYMGKHELLMPIDKVFGFNREGIVAAFKYVASGKHIGKVCINLF